MNEIIQLKADDDESYSFIHMCCTLPHIQAALYAPWQGAGGYHRICSLLDGGDPFVVPVIDGKAVGLVFGEGPPPELRGHLAFFRKVPPQQLRRAMELLLDFSVDLGYTRISAEAPMRAARMFIRRCGFTQQKDSRWIKEL
jgi:hypothetical protein